MSNPFDTHSMGEGYARWRPAVHPHIVALFAPRLGVALPVERALDIGCGAGLSTAALQAVARIRIGLEPSLAMLGNSCRVAPGAWFAAAAAEYLPVRAGSIDLITAAGSLNWADLSRFFPEARRVLSPAGTLVIYDFGQTSEPEWRAEYKRRYPSPPCLSIDPNSLHLAPHGLRLAATETFRVALTLEPDFYLEYVLTETNAAGAIARGIRETEIREWCRSTLAPIFQGKPRSIEFGGYFACITRSGS